MLAKLQHAWRGLDGDQRRAGYAALGLLVCMLLPWYERSTVVIGPQRRALLERQDNLNAFQVFTFIEAAVLLVALGVLVLLYTRGRGDRFQLPGGDGTVIALGGIWAALLFFIRLFDKPDANAGAGTTASIGIQWGFLVAFVAAGALCAAGLRLRAHKRPGSPALRDEDDPPTAATAVAPRRSGPATAATDVVPRRRRPVAPDAKPTRQLSLDDDETEPTRKAPEREPLRPGEIPRAPDR